MKVTGGSGIDCTQAGRWPGWLAPVAGLIAWGMAADARAQAVTEKSFFEELPVVLSATRIPQSLAAIPGAVTVLDRDFIRATGYRDLPSLLKHVPGFQVVAERGGLQHVVYHGLGNSFPNRMQVLIDGRSVYSPYFLGGVDWFAVPVTLEEIERIEVLRGSNSATYGSNAFMGVVNIVTQRAGERPGSGAGVSAGSNALFDLAARHELQHGLFGLRVNAEVRHDHGHPPLQDSARRGVATLRGDYQLDRRDSLSFWLGVNDSRRGFGFDGDPVNADGLRALRAESGFAHLRWHRDLGPAEDLQLAYYHNVEHAREEVSVHLPPFFPVVPVDYNRTSTRDNLEFQHRSAPSATTRTAWGVELRRDATRSPRVFYGRREARQDLARLFGSVEWRAHPSLTLNGGAMLERYSGRRAKLAPRLFANWHVLPRHTLRAGASVAYRAPSIFEEAADMRFYSNGYSGALIQVSWQGQPGVRPERMRAAELGYVGQFRTWNGILDVRVFREEITDFIEAFQVAPPPGVLIPRSHSFRNSDQPVRFRGYEWHYRAQPAPGARIMAGHADVTARSEIDGGALEPRTPRRITTLAWLQDWSGRWSTTLSAVRYSGYRWGSGSLPLPGYTAFDVRLAYRFGTTARPAEVALVLLNQGRRHEEFLLDSEAARGNAVARLAFLSVRWGL
jgi:iron complex outermembrane recepter protein